MPRLLRVKDTNFTVDDIAKFILTEPEFYTALYWQDNFLNYIKRLYKKDLILVFTDGVIKGIFCWFLINKEDEDKINKKRWTLPENIIDGDMLYVGVCILNMGCNISQIRKYFENLEYRKKFKEVTWFRKGMFRRRLNNEN